MTHTEFLENLTAWSQTDKGIMPEGTCPPLRCGHGTTARKKVPPSQRPQVVRIRPGNELRCGCQCPITYLAKKELGREFEVGEWESAAAELGLEDDYQIVDAADMIPGHDKALRANLLAACGVAERSA